MGTTSLDPLVEYLDAHHVLQLATSGSGGPHATPLFYARVPERAELIWISADSTRHSLDLTADPRAGAAVSASDPGLASIRGAQLRGRASAPEERQQEFRSVYLARFPLAAPMVLAASGHRFWVLAPAWARLIRMDAGVKRNLEWEFPGGGPERA